MQCPVDKDLMIVVEHEQVELDYCVTCKGIWFDANELEILMERSGLAHSQTDLEAITRAPTNDIQESRRKCPLCGVRMDKKVAGSDLEIILDRCPHGDGLWFDGDELGQLIQQLLTHDENKDKVISFLGEVFTHDNKQNP